MRLIKLNCKSSQAICPSSSKAMRSNSICDPMSLSSILCSLSRRLDVENNGLLFVVQVGFKQFDQCVRSTRRLGKFQFRVAVSPHFYHGKRREGPSAAGDSVSYSRSVCPQADTSSGRHFDLNAPLHTTLTFAQRSSDRQRKK